MLDRLLRTDFHIHTNLSDCGAPAATPKAILKAAQAAGLEAVGFSDHVIIPAHRLRPAQLRSQVPTRVGEMRVYVGCEADVISPTELAVDEDFARTLDYVLVAASHLYEPMTFHPIEGMDLPAMAAYTIGAMNLAIDSGLADVVVHPFSVPQGMYTFEQLVAAADPEAISRVGEKAARAGVAVEYSPRRTARYPDTARWLYLRLLETGVKIAISSDAHHPRELGFGESFRAAMDEVLVESLTEDRLWRVEDRVSAGRRGLPV